MANSDIGSDRDRLRWAVWIFWACILLAYVVGRFGLTFGVVRVAGAFGGGSMLRRS